MIIEYIQYLSQMNVFSQKWSFLIILLLFIYGSSNFSMIKSNVGITSKVLSEKLKHLESSDLILKRVTTDRPLRVEYTLTDKGKSLVSSVAGIFRQADKSTY